MRGRQDVLLRSECGCRSLRLLSPWLAEMLAGFEREACVAADTARPDVTGRLPAGRAHLAAAGAVVCVLEEEPVRHSIFLQQELDDGLCVRDRRLRLRGIVHSLVREARQNDQQSRNERPT